MNHRDPVKVLPSLSKLLCLVRANFLEDPMPRWMGPAAGAEWAVAPGRMLEFRDRIGEGRFYDISHRAFMSDPMAEIGKFYQWRGWEMNDDIGSRMRGWQESNLRDAQQIRPEDFALDLASVREQYRFYTDRFGAFL